MLKCFVRILKRSHILRYQTCIFRDNQFSQSVCCSIYCYATVFCSLHDKWVHQPSIRSLLKGKQLIEN